MTTRRWFLFGFLCLVLVVGLLPTLLAAPSVHAADPAVWVGTTDTSWSTATNWSGGAVPDSSTDVTIPDATTTPNDPTVDTACYCSSMTIESGGVLNGGSGNILHVSGDWASDGGTFNAGNGSVYLNAAAGTTTVSSTSDFYNLYITGGTDHIVQPNSSITVAGYLYVGSGTADRGTLDINDHTVTVTGQYVHNYGIIDIDGTSGGDGIVHNYTIGNGYICNREGGSITLDTADSTLTGEYLLLYDTSSLNMSAGTVGGFHNVYLGYGSGSADMTISEGSFTTSNFYTGFGGSSTGTLTVSGAASANLGALVNGYGSGSTGNIVLLGGTVSCTTLYNCGNSTTNTPVTGNLTVDGGTLNVSGNLYNAHANGAGPTEVREGYVTIQSGKIDLTEASSHFYNTYGGVDNNMCSGAIDIQGGELEVGGDLHTSRDSSGYTPTTSLIGISGSGVLDVDGSIYWWDSLTETIAGGTIEIAADWTEGNCDGSVSIDSGTVRFDDSSAGTVTALANNHFNDVELVKSTGSTALASSVNINGDFTITSGTWDAAGYDMFVGGNWTNNGTFDAGTGTVTFDGSDGQYISGDTNFHVLTTANTHVSNPVYTTLGTDIDCSYLNVTDGVFTMGANTTLDANGISITAVGVLELGLDAVVTIGGGNTFNVSGTLRSTSGASNKPIIQGQDDSNRCDLDILSDGYIDIDGLILHYLDNDGLHIQPGATIAKLDYVEFNDHPNVADSCYMRVSNGWKGTSYYCSFGSLTYVADSQVNVHADDNDAYFVIMYSTGAGAGEWADYDYNGGHCFWDCKVWFYTVDTDWHNSLNWNPVGVPDQFACVLISSGFQTSPYQYPDTYSGGDICVQQLNIETGGSMTLTGTNLRVRDELILDGGELAVTDSSLIHIGDITILDGCGNWTNNGTFLPGSSTVVFDTGTAACTSIINSGGVGAGKAFHNVELNGARATLSANDIDIDGDFTITSGTWDTGGNGMYVAGDWTNNGTFEAGTGTVTFDGSGNLNSGGITADDDFYNVQVASGTRTVTTNSVRINGKLTVDPGAALQITTGGLDLYTGEGGAIDVDIDGTLETAIASPSGNIYWYVLEGTMVDLDASGTLTLDGYNDSNRIYLRSSAEGNAWYLNDHTVSTSNPLVNYTDVKDSDASGGNTIYADDGTNVDSGNNVSWLLVALVPDVDVSPLSYDFGDVELGSSSATVMTISNVGDVDLTIAGIDFQVGSSGDYSITLAPVLPVVIPPEETVGIEITYSPSILGPSSAILEIYSDDPMDPVVWVSLSGECVASGPTPSEQIDMIGEYIEGLTEDAYKNNPEQRADAFLNKLDDVRALIDASAYQEAVTKLVEDIRAKADGSVDGNPNNDWITDPEAQGYLCGMIDHLVAYLEEQL